MKFIGLARRCATVVFACLMLTGCFPSGDSQLDEKKEPNFITGKNLVSEMDFPGAVDAFEKALEVNPRSASAHFELGWLYEEKMSDPAAAIYHYTRYLKFATNPDNADLARSRINNCKLELAKNVSAVGTLQPAAQREFDRVVAQNKDLQAQIVTMQAQITQLKTAASARPQIVESSPLVAPHPSILVKPDTHSGGVGLRGESHGESTVPNRHSSATTNRTHLIKAGETPAGIARIYGISVSTLLAANPRVRPTHLIVGQTMEIPPH